jgi:class 3 adenylate cyclase
MQSDHIPFNIDNSVERINNIIAAQNASYQDSDSIPSRDQLSYTNGYYINCSAIFVDIRKSSELIDMHKNRVLAKIYRAYISEMSAVINGNVDCSEVNIAGDCVWGVFNTPTQTGLRSVFATAAEISSMIRIINYNLKKNNLAEIKVGIGASWGRALMVKAGYKGSGINEVVWMGSVVNEASKLASYGNREYFDKELMVSSNFQNNLTDEQKNMLTLNNIRNCYHGVVWNSYLTDWYNKNCPPI